MGSMLMTILSLRNILIVVLTPLLLLPLLICIEGQESSCAYVMLIMAIFWVTEALPINVTALLPVFMFPAVGVMSAGDVGSVFFNSTTLMFIGGMTVAVAIEEWQIHKRIALKTLLTVGARPVWLMLGLMLTAWFLSIWISNTATTAMMLPIVTAILNELKGNKTYKKHESPESNQVELLLVKKADENGHIDFNEQADVEIHVSADDGNGHNKENGVIQVIDDDDDGEEADESWSRMSKALSLCIAYSANIGGTASMTGSTPNLVLKGQLEMVYGKLGKESPVTFGGWLLFGIPTTFVIVILSWLWLQAYFLRCRGWSGCCVKKDNVNESLVRQILKEQYKKLGSFSFGQIAVMFHLVAIALLWITRDMGGSSGWSGLFKDKFIKDSVPAIFVGCLLFIFPSQLPGSQIDSNRESKFPMLKPLLTWKVFNAKMPWGIVFLLGGGFSMAKAAQVSGLSAWIGNQLSELTHLEPWFLNLVLCFIVAAVTEVTSNTATTSLMLPILADLSITIGIEPVYLMFSTAVASSFAFMLPVATPPNAVVFSYGFIKVIDMVKAGAMLNIIAVLVLVASNEFLGKLIFGNM
ncbi:Na(+)/citrate cotransporter-like isoform X2 [Mercenaria mercenaria]|uniref:Na(+)/citrate cotransporter-like isoform X2 n=1 Tax=Mercenaria mercenaria TaxID=6596 RepID=UPI00234E6EF2|nr:Na(+)/citrate cotransporter-like isoform X2 [Mercenaria mercenaria]